MQGKLIGFLPRKTIMFSTDEGNKECTERERDLPRPGRRMLRVRQRAARERGNTGRAPRITDVTSTRWGGNVSSFTVCQDTHKYRWYADGLCCICAWVYIWMTNFFVYICSKLLGWAEKKPWEGIRKNYPIWNGRNQRRTHHWRSTMMRRGSSWAPKEPLE